METFNFLLNLKFNNNLDEQWLGGIIGPHVSKQKLQLMPYLIKEGYRNQHDLFTKISSSDSFIACENIIKKNHTSQPRNIIYVFFEHFISSD